MIGEIPWELEEAKKETKVDFKEIKKETFETIKKNIRKNIGIEVDDYYLFIWEDFPEPVNICGGDAWEYIKDILPQEECYMFFNPAECKRAYLFKNSKDVCTVIGETYGFEFYVTDFEGTYIICDCHEEILIGCGKAKVWMDEFIKNNLHPHQDDSCAD